MPSPFLPRVKGLAPRLDGKQDDENDGEKSTVCNKINYYDSETVAIHINNILPCTVIGTQMRN